MALSKLVLLAVLVCFMSQATARYLPTLRTSHDLAARLQGESIANCWNALSELRSCSNEIVLFFLNGESYLGQDCCRAIRIITHQCWPAMLASIGFTAQEGDILRGYCDATIPNPAGAPPPSTAPIAAGFVAAEEFVV